MPLCEDVLLAREARSNLIAKLSSESDVVSVKANVVGADKLIPFANLIVSHFSCLIYKKWGYKPIILKNSDGLCHIFSIVKGNDLKDYTVSLEESHPLGRLVDIDVTLKGEAAPASRGFPRRCFICDNPAFVCGRLKAHSQEDLLNFFNKSAYDYFYHKLLSSVQSAMMCELSLEDKFGLVTPSDNGSHPDMSFDLMLKAQDAITPYLAKSFFVGLEGEDPKYFIDVLRPLGLEAERAMFSSTNGVNCYKGFIFIAMIILSAFAFTLKTNGDLDTVFSVAKEISTHPSLSDPIKTFGFKAYKGSFKGIRGEAQSGFLSVKSACVMLKNQPPIKVLASIVGMIDDTVLLKRCGNTEKYLYYKKLISIVDTSDRSALKSVTDLCVKENLSVGGAADILIAASLVNTLTDLFYIK